MGKETWPRVTGDVMNTPGPGAYSIPSTFGSGPKYSIKKVYPEKPIETTAGPELPQDSSNDSPRFTIGASLPIKSETDSPGPSYIPPPMGQSSFKIKYPQRGDKRKLAERTIGENVSYSKGGPAEFNITSNPSQPTPPSYSIGVRTDNDSWLKLNDNPSPLDYSPKIQDSGPKYSIRIAHDLPPDTSMPGPADYPNRPTDKKYAYIHVPHYEPKMDETPGPGKYQVEPVFAKDARACSIRPTVTKREDVNRAPYYDPAPTEFTRVKGRTIPKSPRMEVKRDSSPGPAAYSPRFSQFNAGHKLPVKKTAEEWAKEKEKEIKRLREGTPGPGAYKINYTSVEKSSPHFGFYGDRAPLVPSDTPGPSDYLYSVDPVSPRSPRFTIKHRDNRPERASFTQNAGYVALPPLDRGPMYSIRPREKLNLIAE